METIPVPSKRYTDQDLEEMYKSFLDYYQSIYGEGAAFVEAGLEIMTFIVRAIRPSILSAMSKHDRAGQSSSPALKGKRDVFLAEAGRFVPVDLYEFDLLRPGKVVAGPAIIEATTTTMLMLGGQVATIDEYKNVRIIEGG